MVERQFCAQVSREAADPFIGTAARADLWLLIEYRGAWARDEILSSDLPAQVKDWIDHTRTFYTQTRLIKRNKSRSEYITVFVACVLEQRQVIYRFQLERYEDLLQLDLEALRDGDSCYEQYCSHEPLFLVCTHGKHDACCAKFGMPVYNELERLAGDYTWQSSHVGGDKFAANVVCLPQNIYYGRVAVSEVSQKVTGGYALNPRATVHGTVCWCKSKSERIQPIIQPVMQRREKARIGRTVYAITKGLRQLLPYVLWSHPA